MAALTSRLTWLFLVMTLLARPNASQAQPAPIPDWLHGAEERILPCRAITHPPRRHFFAYYDVAQFDHSGRYVLAMAIVFELRSQTAEDAVTIGMIDLKDNDRWTTLGTTTAWSWQQGCRLQWRPGSDHEVLWNDREGGKYVCRLLDVSTMKCRTLPMALEHVSHDGQWALCGDFARIARMRPSCGYFGIEDAYKNEPAPRESGAWKMNLDTGERALIVPFSEIAALPSPDYDVAAKRHHYLNHFGWSHDGTRFAVINRGDKIDRLLAGDADGRNLRFITAAPSHYCWAGEDAILCWTRGAYRLFKADGSSGPEGKILFSAPNGHHTLLPGGEWMLTDTYPQGKERLQYLYLYNMKSGKKVVIGKFFSPPQYDRRVGGEQIFRCDLHPRLRPDGTQVIIDSVHEGGRQMYLIDIDGIVGKK